VNIEQSGIIFDIKRYAVHDGPGIRTTVFLKGCPLDCWWCHNPESKAHEPEKIRTRRRSQLSAWKDKTAGRSWTVAEVMAELLQDRIFYDQSGGGVTFSGGEPLMQADFLTALLEASKMHGLHTAVDTSGYASWESFGAILPCVDLFLYDLKILAAADHHKHTGVSNEWILENLGRLLERKTRVELRIPLIPEITDTAANLTAIRDFLGNLSGISQLSLLPYNRLAEDKIRRNGGALAKKNLQIQTPAALARMAGIFREAGYTVTIGG